MEMDPHSRGVDHARVVKSRLRQPGEQAIPDTGFAPAIVAVVSCCVGAVALRQVPPRCAGLSIGMEPGPVIGVQLGV